MPSSLELRPVSTPSFFRACRRRVTLLMQPLTSAMTYPYPQAARSLRLGPRYSLLPAAARYSHTPTRLTNRQRGSARMPPSSSALFESRRRGRPDAHRRHETGEASGFAPLELGSDCRRVRESGWKRNAGGTFRGRPSPRDSRIGFVVCYSQHGRAADWEIP